MEGTDKKKLHRNRNKGNLSQSHFGLLDIASISSRDMSWIRVKLDAPWQFQMTPPLAFHWIKEGPKQTLVPKAGDYWDSDSCSENVGKKPGTCPLNLHQLTLDISTLKEADTEHLPVSLVQGLAKPVWSCLATKRSLLEGAVRRGLFPPPRCQSGLTGHLRESERENFWKKQKTKPK